MFNFHKLTKGSEFESGFIKDGKRVRCRLFGLLLQGHDSLGLCNQEQGVLST